MNPSVVPLPTRGDVFLDVRGGGRGMRVSWHHEHGVVVVSLWRADTCVGTLQLAHDEVPRLVAALTDGLAEGYAADNVEGVDSVDDTAPPQAS